MSKFHGNRFHYAPGAGEAQGGGTGTVETGKDGEKPSTDEKPSGTTQMNNVLNTGKPEIVEPRRHVINATVVELSRIIEARTPDGNPFRLLTFEPHGANPIGGNSLAVNVDFVDGVNSGDNAKKLVANKNVALTVQEAVAGRTQYIDKEGNVQTHKSSRFDIVNIGWLSENQVQDFRTKKTIEAKMEALKSVKDDPELMKALAIAMQGS